MTNATAATSPTTYRQSLALIGGIAILAGFILTIISLMGICTEACEEGHTYRIFGLSFETLGLIYFPVLFISYLFSRSSPHIALFTGIILASGLGAEILFLLIQKYALHHWCPLCLGIAASVTIASIILTLEYIEKLKLLLKQGKRSEITQTLMRAVICLAALFVGFALSFMGISKQDSLQLAESNVQEKIAFGKADSKIEIFLFTSWSCPACQKLEPSLTRIIPPLLDKAKIVFVDHISDTKTLNFTPFNLSFMLHDKNQYLDLRTILREIAKVTEAPTDAQVAQAAAKLHVKYQKPDYADVDMAVDYFKELSTKYDISSLPSVIVIDTASNRHKKLSGTTEVSTAGIAEAIKEVEQQ